MKSYLLAPISSLALVGAATAADFSPAAEAIWTGPYAGLNVGAIGIRTSVSFDPLFTGSERFGATGVTLGGQVGYNWQQDSFVYGVEADLNWSSARASESIGIFDLSSRLDWYATLRGRAGFTNSPTLYYLTGGVAFAGIRNSASSFLGLQATSGTRTGWVAGGGVEHMFTHNKSVKAEILYMDFGRASGTGGGYTGNFHNTAVVGRLGVNLRW